MRNLVSMLVQSEQFGTSIAKTLRVHSEMLRTKRVQEIEEKAAKLSIKLLFPLVLFIFPSLFVVVIGPVGHHHDGVVQINVRSLKEGRAEMDSCHDYPGCCRRIVCNRSSHSDSASAYAGQVTELAPWSRGPYVRFTTPTTKTSTETEE